MARAAQPTGCLGRLLFLPRLLLFPARTSAPAALPAPAGLLPEERAAVEEARQAVARVHAALHRQGRLVDPAVLDQVGSGITRLYDAVVALSAQLAEARAWSRQNDPEALRRKLTDLELQDDAPGFVARQEAMRALRDRSRLARQLADELPALSARLRAAADRLAALEARLQLDTLHQDAAQATAQLQTLEAQSARELEALRATVAELRALS